MESPVLSLKDISWHSLCNWIIQTYEDLVKVAHAQYDNPEEKYKTEFKKLLCISSPSPIKETIYFENSVLLPVCKHIESMIDVIPCSLANEATEKLMACICKQLIFNRTHFVYTSKCSIYVLEEKMRLLKYIAIEMLRAIFHPQTTILEFPKYLQPELFFKYIWTPELTLKMKKVTVIRNHVPLIISYFSCESFLEFVEQLRLKEFTFLGCTDELLTAVANSSADSLKILNVSRSECISNYSMRTIMKFENLVSLSIDNTAMTPYTVSMIIDYFLNREKELLDESDDFHLESFSGIVTSCDLNRIEKFKKIRHLRLRLRGNMSVIKLPNMRNLTCLDIGGLLYWDHGYFRSEFYNISCTFEERMEMYLSTVSKITFADIKIALDLIGHQLKELTMREIDNINLKYVGQRCPQLRHLGLYMRMYYQTSDNSYEDLKMPSLESLTIHGMENEHMQILTSLVGFKRLEISRESGIFSNFLENFVWHRINEGELKEFIIYGNQLIFDGYWKKNGIRIPDSLVKEAISNMVTPAYIKYGNLPTVLLYHKTSRWNTFRANWYTGIARMKLRWKRIKRRFIYGI